MRFIRKSKIRDKFVDFLTKGILIAFSALVCLWMISGAKAEVQIKDIQYEENEDGINTVYLILSENLPTKNIEVEYQRNFIQISMRGVSAYPAKTKNINKSLLDKVFTYQYQPELARARILLKPPVLASSSKGEWLVENNKIKITYRSDKDILVNGPITTDKLVNKSSANDLKNFSIVSDEEEEKIRKDILSGGGVGKQSTNAEDLPLFKENVNEPKNKVQENKTSTSRIFSSLILVLGLIGAGSLAYRRFVQGKGLGFQAQQKMIQVVSTQTIGPKKSISIVKVLDQYLVVGVGSDAMNLLLNLGPNVDLEKFSEEFPIGASFKDTLSKSISFSSQALNTADAMEDNVTNRRNNETKMGFRASIKKRLEGFKPL